MELVFYFLILPLMLAVTVWGSVTLYRRYKDNQLETHISDEGLDIIGDEWQKSILCTEEYKEPKQIVFLYVAEKIYDDYKLDYLKNCYKHYNKERECNEYDPTDVALAHNSSLERMKTYLADKDLRSCLGGQVVDFFASCTNRPMPVPVRIYIYRQTFKSPHAVAMPSFEEMTHVTAIQAQAHSDRALNTHIADVHSSYYAGISVESSPTVGQILKSIEDKKKADEFFMNKNALATALVQIQKNLEDDIFHHKVELEERDKRITDLKDKLEALEARPIVQDMQTIKVNKKKPRRKKK